MSQQINRAFINFKDVFIGRQEEIRNYIDKHFKKDFKERIVEKVERIDATKKIKTSGFRNNFSSWRDSERNILISTCLLVNGEQKRYDYKFIFLKEKFLSHDIEKMKKALNEVDDLREKLKLKIAVVKLDSATKLAKEMNIPIYLEELTEIKNEITALEKDYNKKLDQLVENLRIHRENNNIDEALKDCDEIIEISNTINRSDLMEKYNQITNRIMKEMIADKEKRESAQDRIRDLEKQIDQNRENKNFNEAITNCKQVIHIAKSNELIDVIENYNQLLDLLENEQIKLDGKSKELMKELKELDEKIEITLANEQLEESLMYSEKCVQISEALEDDDLLHKYIFISKRIQKRIIDIDEQNKNFLAKLNELDQKLSTAREDHNLVVALGFCESIIQLSRSANRIDIMDKYSEMLKQIKSDIENRQQELINEKLEQLKTTVRRLNKEGIDALYDNKLIKSLEKYKEIKENLVQYLNKDLYSNL